MRITYVSLLTPLEPAARSMRQVEVDGQPVGPVYLALSDRIGGAEQVAHDWMVRNHPGVSYSIASTRSGHCFRRVSHQAAIVAKQYDYSPW